MDAIKITTKAVYGEQKDDELCLMFPIQRSDYWKAKRLLEHMQDALLRNSIPPLEITVKEAKKHRSLDQNAYLWALLGEIARVIGTSNREVYLAVLEAYTTPMWLTMPAAARNDLLREPFRIIHVENTLPDGKIEALCWKSSKYLDTKEFSHLLDMTLEEARQVGIDPEAVKLGLLDDKAY